jgi:hypothetical protein
MRDGDDISHARRYKPNLHVQLRQRLDGHDDTRRSNHLNLNNTPASDCNGNLHIHPRPNYGHHYAGRSCCDYSRSNIFCHQQCRNL